MIPARSTIAVTGASGFLGGHIVDALRSAGHQVVAVVRDPARAAHIQRDGVELRRADLASTDALAAAFSGVDAVIANAALGSRSGPDDAYVKTNIEGAENTVRAAERAGVRRLVYVSTVAVYRARLFRALGEDAPQRADQVGRFDLTRVTTDHRYSVSKTLAERSVRALATELDLELTVVRPGPIYGSGDTRFTARLIKQTRAGVTVVPTVRLPLVHAADVAAAITSAVAQPCAVGRTYNLAGPPTSLLAAARALRRAADSRAMLVPLWVPVWAGFDSTAAARDIGFTCRDIDAGMREVIEGARQTLAGD